MCRINRIIPVILILMTSCQKAPQRDTAVLSGQTQAIIDLFLRENKESLSDGKQLIIEGLMTDDKTCFFLNIYDNDSSMFKPYGKYNGITHHHGYDIFLFGDSWNESFWKCDTIYDLPDMNNSERYGLFYDPIGWNICICCNDTTINRQKSDFLGFSSMSDGTYNSIICDAIQMIINPH